MILLMCFSTGIAEEALAYFTNDADNAMRVLKTMIEHIEGLYFKSQFIFKKKK